MKRLVYLYNIIIYVILRDLCNFMYILTAQQNVIVGVKQMVCLVTRLSLLVSIVSKAQICVKENTFLIIIFIV